MSAHPLSQLYTLDGVLLGWYLGSLETQKREHILWHLNLSELDILVFISSSTPPGTENTVFVSSAIGGSKLVPREISCIL